MKRYIIIWVLAIGILTIAAMPAFTQETQPEELAVYGEVQSVNKDANSMKVQYYDYDSDEERTLEVTLGKDTKIENAAALGDIKEADWVDVTYSSSGGKNVAKTINVEKIEEELPPTKEEAVEEEY